LLAELENNQDDRGALVTECTAIGNDAGAGKAIGILLDDVTDAAILKNTTAFNISSAKKGQGFGIYTVDKNNEFLILQNIAYGNEEKNYRIKGKDIPIIELSQDDVGDYKDNPWYNISIKS